MLCACRVAVLAVASLAACTSRTQPPPSSGTAASFAAGQTLTYIVATDPGGGYDAYGRLVSRYLVKHLGAANVVVRNVSGGGNIRGLQALVAAPPDGLTLGTFNTGMLYTQLVDETRLPIDLRTMGWVGKAGGEPRVLVVSSRLKAATVPELRGIQRPLLIGAGGVGTGGYNDAVLVSRALRLPVKVVLGFTGADAQLSMIRGELDAELASYSSYRTFIRNEYGKALLRVGEDAELAGVPDAHDLVNDAVGRSLLALVHAQALLLRWTAAPPATPPDRLQAVRTAYMAALADPALRAEAAKMGLPIVPMDGASLQRAVERVLDQPRATLDLLRELLAPRQAVR